VTVHHPTSRRREDRRRKLLDPRADDLLAVIHQLTLLQVDPTAAVAPNPDLVAWSRLGSAYQPAQLRQALEVNRTLFEFDSMIRPIGDLPLYYRLPSSAWFQTDKPRNWMAANDRFRLDILDRLRDAGALISRDIPDTAQAPWPSSGWTNSRNVTQMLEF
jgi:uncharacterized protein YcaQ